MPQDKSLYPSLKQLAKQIDTFSSSLQTSTQSDNTPIEKALETLVRSNKKETNTPDAFLALLKEIQHCCISLKESKDKKNLISIIKKTLQTVFPRLLAIYDNLYLIDSSEPNITATHSQALIDAVTNWYKALQKKYDFPELNIDFNNYRAEATLTRINRLYEQYQAFSLAHTALEKISSLLTAKDEASQSSLLSLKSFITILLVSEPQVLDNLSTIWQSDGFSSDIDSIKQILFSRLNDVKNAIYNNELFYFEITQQLLPERKVFHATASLSQRLLNTQVQLTRNTFLAEELKQTQAHDKTKLTINTPWGEHQLATAQYDSFKEELKSNAIALEQLETNLTEEILTNATAYLSYFEKIQSKRIKALSMLKQQFNGLSVWLENVLTGKRTETYNKAKEALLNYIDSLITTDLSLIDKLIKDKAYLKTLQKNALKCIEALKNTDPLAKQIFLSFYTKLTPYWPFDAWPSSLKIPQTISLQSDTLPAFVLNYFTYEQRFVKDSLNALTNAVQATKADSPKECFIALKTKHLTTLINTLMQQEQLGSLTPGVLISPFITAVEDCFSETLNNTALSAQDKLQVKLDVNYLKQEKSELVKKIDSGLTDINSDLEKTITLLNALNATPTNTWTSWWDKDSENKKTDLINAYQALQEKLINYNKKLTKNYLQTTNITSNHIQEIKKATTRFQLDLQQKKQLLEKQKEGYIDILQNLESELPTHNKEKAISEHYDYIINQEQAPIQNKTGLDKEIHERLISSLKEEKQGIIIEAFSQETPFIFINTKIDKLKKDFNIEHQKIFTQLKKLDSLCQRYLTFLANIKEDPVVTQAKNISNQALFGLNTVLARSLSFLKTQSAKVSTLANRLPESVPNLAPITPYRTPPERLEKRRVLEQLQTIIHNQQQDFSLRLVEAKGFIQSDSFAICLQRCQTGFADKVQTELSQLPSQFFTPAPDEETTLIDSIKTIRSSLAVSPATP